MSNASITLVTGTPGAGKSLKAVSMLRDYAKQGRKTFQIGIDGCSSDVAEELTIGFEDWSTLPPGCVVAIDECHKVLPARGPGKPPPHIEKLTEVRHFGIDLILLTQDPRNMDHFVRRLVGRHFHLSNKMGMNVATVYEFQGCAEDPNDYHARKAANSTVWPYPKDLFQKYHSATLHTKERNIPWKMYAAGVFVLVVLAFIAYAVWYFSTQFGGSDGLVPEPDSQGIAQALTSPPGHASPNSRAQKGFSSQEEFVNHYTPLVDGIPWSAPAYQHLEPVASPRIGCILVDDEPRDRCRCVTEQATPIQVTFRVCREIARYGIYHPHVDVNARAFGGDALRAEAQVMAEPSGLPTSAEPPESGGSGSWPERGINLPYQPPELSGLGYTPSR